jgi:hypothetical protein
MPRLGRLSRPRINADQRGYTPPAERHGQFCKLVVLLDDFKDRGNRLRACQSAPDSTQAGNPVKAVSFLPIGWKSTKRTAKNIFVIFRMRIFRKSITFGS